MSDMKNLPKVGETVTWKWRAGTVSGEVLFVNPERVEIASKGKLIVRNGTAENPAVTILHASGNEVLKLASELILG